VEYSHINTPFEEGGQSDLQFIGEQAFYVLRINYVTNHSKKNYGNNRSNDT
jgi:hypothetical protein